VSDRVHDIRGAQTPRGQRQVQVRVMADSTGQEFWLHELHLIRPNGDWDYVDTCDASEAIGWLCGDDS